METPRPALRVGVWRVSLAFGKRCRLKPAFRAGGVVREREGRAFRPPSADSAGVNTGAPSRRCYPGWKGRAGAPVVGCGDGGCGFPPGSR